MAEFEGIEIPVDLLGEVAGGTLNPELERVLTREAIRYRDAGKSKDNCIRLILSTHGGTFDDVAAIVGKVYA